MTCKFRHTDDHILVAALSFFCAGSNPIWSLGHRALCYRAKSACSCCNWQCHVVECAKRQRVLANNALASSGLDLLLLLLVCIQSRCNLDNRHDPVCSRRPDATSKASRLQECGFELGCAEVWQLRPELGQPQAMKLGRSRPGTSSLCIMCSVRLGAIRHCVPHAAHL